MSEMRRQATVLKLLSTAPGDPDGAPATPQRARGPPRERDISDPGSSPLGP